MNRVLGTSQQGARYMPRKPRYYLPEIPCHIIQRGNNRQASFYADDDYRFYLQCLSESAKRYQCAIHAYVLMTNHVHLLMTPATGAGISRVMQSVGRRYVQYINYTYKRTGTLWEGRHKASLIQRRHYLLKCYRYIELNPVRAGMVDQPGEYRWSSYRSNAEGRANPLITAHPEYLLLGATAAERQDAYRDLFKSHMDSNEIKEIRRAITHDVPLGNERFREEIEAMLGRRIQDKRRGRPKKEQSHE